MPSYFLLTPLILYILILFEILLCAYFAITILHVNLTNNAANFESIQTEKVEVYECGFDSIDNARIPINAHFYMYGLVFLIFDIEVMFLFPWAATHEFARDLENIATIIILLIIISSLIYEWLVGALEWL
jgi:NADH:ubiquinone oxidoreductase subunit 3 (subunit A)